METLLLKFYSIVNNIFAQFDIALSSGTGQAVAIIIGVFLFTLLFAFTRHHMLTWSIKGALFGVVMGIIITLVSESFLLVGGKTVIFEIAHNPNTPKVVVDTLRDASVELSRAFGPDLRVLSAAASPSASILETYHQLKSSEQGFVRSAICRPSHQ